MGRRTFLLCAAAAAELSVSYAAYAAAYAYDALGRLTSFVSDDGRQTIYSYDAAGNRTSVTTTTNIVKTAPDAKDDTISYAYGGAAPSFDPRINDITGGSALSIVGLSPPQFGTATFTAGAITYTPPASQVLGSDIFTYSVQNASGLTDSAVIQINLSAALPIANPDAISGYPNTALSVSPLQNDSDPAGNPLTIASFTQPAHGVVTQSGGVLTYISARGYRGGDSFTYVVSNGQGGQSQATVSVSVQGNRPPTAEAIDLWTFVGQDSQLTKPAASDPDGDTLTLSGTQGSRGGVNYNSNGIIYSPYGTQIGIDQFTYTVTDPFGAQASALGYVTISTND